MLLPPLRLLITVTFSTPTPDNNRSLPGCPSTAAQNRQRAFMELLFALVIGEQ